MPPEKNCGFNAVSDARLASRRPIPVGKPKIS
jgi:hypothetical protein